MMRRNWRTLFIALAFLIDSAAIATSGFLAYGFRSLFTGLPPLNTRIFATVVFITWFSLLFFASLLGLYRAAYHAERSKQYALSVKSFLYTMPIVLSLIYILQWENFPRRFTLALFILIPIFFLIGRRILEAFNKFMQQYGYGIHNTLIVGYNGLGERVIKRFQTIPELGYRIKALVTSGVRAHHKPTYPAEYNIGHFKLSQLPSIVERERVDRIFVPSLEEVEELPNLVETCEQNNVKLKVLSPESEDLLRFFYIHDLAGITLYAPPRRKTARIKRITKRIFDIIGSLLTLLLVSPIFLLAVSAILIEDGFPIFFRQRRALVKGKDEFHLLKFRSMRKDADARRSELDSLNIRTGGLFFVENDPRITRVGKILRRFSIDELPQLLNVLKGEMSLTGPRPLSIPDLESITPENRMKGYYEHRGEAKPGMTGLWQISGRREVNFKEMILLDLYYIENQSIMLDLEIMFATIPVVFFGRGAY